MMRRKRETALHAPSTADLLENSSGNLGIRKPTQSADYRISPSLRRTGGRNKDQYSAVSAIPLGIEPSPFINHNGLISPGDSSSEKPSSTESTVDSDDENLYIFTKAKRDDEDHDLIDDHLFKTVATYQKENEELSTQGSIASLMPTTTEISLDRKGGVEFHMRNRDLIKPTSLHAQIASREQGALVITPTKGAPQPTPYQTPPAKDDTRRATGASPLGSLRPFSLKSSPRDKPIHHATGEGKQRRPSKSSSIRIKEPRISLSGKKKFSANSARGTVKDSVTDEPLIKVFLLLLQPKAKIFELIQIFFPPSVTTVGDIIHLIPANATEAALGAQKYIGLVRPRRRSKEYTNLSVMACGNAASMGITHGEILIAIPEECEARYMIGISKQILSNPRIRTLLEKSASSLRVSSSVGEKGIPMAVVKEEPETPPADEHLKRAQYFAEASNAGACASPNEFPSTADYGVVSDFCCDAPDDLYNFNGSYTDNLDDLSLQGSYSSWSRSFDSSVASVSRSAFVTEPVVKTPRRHKKHYSAAVKVTGAVLLYMIIRFCLDSSVTAKTSPDNVLGIGGFLQFFLCFVSLVKMQRHKQRKAKKQPTRCPFIQHMKD